MSKTRMGKRVASLLLSLVMMLSLLPTTVYAMAEPGETTEDAIALQSAADNAEGEEDAVDQNAGDGNVLGEGETGTGDPQPAAYNAEGEEDAVAPLSGEEGADAALLAANGNTFDVTQGNVDITAADGETYTISGNGTQTSNTAKITLASGTATVVLDNVNMSCNPEWPEWPGVLTLNINGSATLVLELDGTNKVCCTDSFTDVAAVCKTGEGYLVIVDENETPGSLTAQSKSITGAAIGSRNYTDVCNIEIRSGTVNAEAKSGAAIGSAVGGKANGIVISGGNVTAKTTNGGAAIGVGQHGTGGDVTISGGTVNATSIHGGAAIGAGSGTSACVDSVLITDGNVTATATSSGAAIGSGYQSKVNQITISGGRVEATASEAAAIGAGSGTTTQGGVVETISISGGDVTVYNKSGSTKSAGYIGAKDGTGTVATSGSVSIANATVKNGSNVADYIDTDKYEYDATTGEIKEKAPAAYVTVNGVKYETLEAAIDAATPDANGVITYAISGKVETVSTGWIQVVAASQKDTVKKVVFVGASEDAEICIATATPETPAILADQSCDIDVSFENLTLSRPKGTNVNDLGHGNSYFTCWLRNTNAAENTVTYTNCTFPNGVCNNQYGKTVFENCKFNNETADKYNLWNYGGDTVVKNSTFTGTRGIKAYNEGTLEVAPTVKVENTSFTGLSEKAAIVVSKATNVTLAEVSATGCEKGLIQKDIEYGTLKTTIEANGTGISGEFNITATTTEEAAKTEFNISAGTFTSAVAEDYLAEGFTIEANSDGTYGVTEAAGVNYDTDSKTITNVTRENVQDVLDGKYGSLDGMTVILSEGVYDALELGRATAYEGSNTAYMVGGFDSTAANYQEFKTAQELIDYKNGTAWTPSCYYIRSMKGVTIRAEEDATVTVKGLTATSGHIYGKADAPVCDYVRGIDDIRDTNNSFYLAQKWQNVTFEGITFTAGVDINSSLAQTTISGTTFRNCTFEGCEEYKDKTPALHYYNEINNGKVSGLTVENCSFNNWYQGVYTMHINGVTVKDSKFANTTHNAIAIQDMTACNHGKVVITDNTFTNISNRVIRFNNVAAGTTITITGNTATNSGNKDKEVIAATDIADGVTIDMTSTPNNWGEGAVLGTGFAAAYVAQIGDVKYETLKAAVAAAGNGETVKLLADVTADVKVDKNITLDLNGKTLTGTGTSGTATVTIAEGATATVQNGTILGTANSYYTIQNNGTATLEGVTATAGNTGSSMLANWGTLTITSGTYTGGLNVVKSEEGSTLVINGGKFTLSYATNGYTGVIFAYGTTTITGGEFIQSLSTTGKWNHPQVILAGVVEGYTSSVTVTGGSFTNKLSSEAIFRGVGKATSDNFEVSGGTFNKSISDSYCAEGFIPTKNSDGTYSVKKGSYVAAIGSTNYETLEAAITAAKKGKTVKLLTDVEQNSELSIDKSITLDLNGKKIYNTVDIWNAKSEPAIVSLIDIEGGADVTITGNGTIAAKENDCYTINLTDGNLTIENGTFVGNVSAVQVFKGTLTIKGGHFSLLQQWDGSSKYLINCIDDAFTAGDATVAIYGGTFVGFDPNVSPEAKVDGKVPSFAAEGVGITKDEDGNFIAKAGMTAQIVDAEGNSVAAYETLANAVAAAESGQTVKLLTNIDSSVSAKYSAQNLTIDLNGYTIKGGTLSTAALKLAAKAVRDANYAVTITSSKDGGAIIGQLPLQLGGDYQANEIKIAIDDSVKLTVLEGGTNAVNQTGSCVYLVGTDTTKAYYKNGGFMVTVNGEDRIYETLGNARSADPNVTLLNDYTTSTCLNIWESWGAVTLDLDGHTYESTSARGNMFELHEDGVSITFKNGTLRGKAASVVGSVANETRLVLENVTVDASGDYGIATNGSCTGIKITLNDSSIKAPNGVGVYFPSTGSLTIDGGSILANTGVQVCAGSLNITGGSITATGTSTEDVSSGSILDGAAVSIIKRGGYGALDTLSISGGTFISASGVAAVQTYAVTDAGKAEWTPETGFITGGSFNNIPDNMQELCAEGYTYTMPTDDDPMYYVVKADEERIDVKRSLTLGNTLIMNYKVLLPEGYTNPRIVFESYDAKAGAFYSVPVKDYTKQEKDEETRYVFAFTETNPQRMTDTLKATVYATKDGTEKAFPIDDYSVANYCNALLASDANKGGKYNELVGNLVAYGTAAQLYQNYHTDKLVEDVVNGGAAATYPISGASVVNNLTEVSGGVKIETKSLVLNNAFAIRVKFTLEGNTTIDQVKFTVDVDGKTTKVESFHEGTLSNGTSCYYFDFADLNSRQLGSTVTFTAVVDDTNNDVLEFSANTYLKLMAEREGVSTELRDLLTTLYSYGCTCGNFK